MQAVEGNIFLTTAFFVDLESQQSLLTICF